MPGDRETLLDFGFDPARVDWALKATAGRGLQPALDHIVENESKPVPVLDSVTESTSQAAGADNDEDEDTKMAIQMAQEGQEAKSIKCTQCGKIFRNTALANFHAEKSGHDQFEESVEEIKPLTEEEKKARLAELRQKMTEKRAVKSAEEAKEQKANEDLRRRAGKDAGQIREELKKKEAMKEAEQRRKDKIEDAKARAAVKAQIEADRKARADKAAAEKALRDGQAPPPVASTSSSATQPSAPAVKKEYTETRLQIRVAGVASPLTMTLGVDKGLQEVAEFVASQSLAIDVESVTFSTTFPRKIYSRQDWSKSLKELGLVPSAVLIAS